MSIKGTCERTVPKEEEERRVSLRLISPFEKGLASCYGEPILFKMYERSAAGKEMNHASVRTFEALKTSTYMLLNDVVEHAPTDASVLDCFTFLCDRLRSVRQDHTVQPSGKLQYVEHCPSILRIMFLFDALLASELQYSYKLFTKELNDVLNVMIEVVESGKNSTHELIAFLLVGFMGTDNPTALLQRLQSALEQTNRSLQEKPLEHYLLLFATWHSQQWHRFLRQLETSPLWVRIALFRYRYEATAQQLRLWARSAPKSLSTPAASLRSLVKAHSEAEVIVISEHLGIEANEKGDLLCHKQPLRSAPHYVPHPVLQPLSMTLRAGSKGLKCEILQTPPSAAMGEEAIDLALTVARVGVSKWLKESDL